MAEGEHLSQEQMERAVTALVPFVDAWNLPLNPEDLYEIAYAVLLHAAGGAQTADFERIEDEVRQQLEEYRVATEKLQRSYRILSHDRSSALDEEH